MSDSDLRERFADLWVRLGGHGDVTPRLDSVLQSWQEPHRHYHGLDHLRDCLARLDESPATGMERDLAEAALWYHDVIYRPGAPDNEARSAELARYWRMPGACPPARTRPSKSCGSSSLQAIGSRNSGARRSCS